MPGSGLLSLAIAMGRSPQELLDDEPEYWLNRLLLYHNPNSYLLTRS